MPESQPQKEPKIGRPSDYSDALADAICERISDGESLRSICRDDEMPDKRTVLRWLKRDDREDFRTQYASAHETQADTLAAEILEIADDGSNDFMTITKGDNTYTIENKEWTSRSKLRVEARFKLMALLAPKKYGTKHVDHTTGGEAFKAYAGFDPAQV